MAKPIPHFERDELIARLRDLAARLGKRTVTRHEFARELRITSGQLQRFGRFRDYAQAAGLQPYPGKFPLTDDELLSALRDDIAKLGRPLQVKYFGKIGRYHMATYRKRWGSWRGALTALVRWLEWREPGFPKLDAIRARVGKVAPREPAPLPQLRQRPCGSPLNFGTLRHAPLNEQGVVFLFGALASELGFVVETITSAFPDCTAKRRMARSGNFWAPVRIEFEHESRNFKAHGHDPKGCDLIVCWEHNWPECPLEVIELKKVVAAS